MPYTFGAASSHYMSKPVGSGVYGGSQHYLMAGWYYPTTLTAARGLWGGSTTATVRVGATTSEIEWIRDLATTDAVYSSSGAGITTNKWWFIAMLLDSSGTNNFVVYWIGDEQTVPVQVSGTSLVSGSGGAATTSTLVAGNSIAGGSTSFQGHIANLFLLQATANTILNGLGFQPSGATTQADIDRTYGKYVLPLYRGEFNKFFNHGLSTAQSGSAAQNFVLFWPMREGARIIGFDGLSGASMVINAVPTISGATFTTTVADPRPGMSARDFYAPPGVPRRCGRR